MRQDAKRSYGSSRSHCWPAQPFCRRVSRPRCPPTRSPASSRAPNSRSSSTAPSAACTPPATNGKYEAWLDAWTELKDGQFSYEIVSERGSDTARGKVLRADAGARAGAGEQRRRPASRDLTRGQLRIHRGRPRRRRRARRPDQAAPQRRAARRRPRRAERRRRAASASKASCRRTRPSGPAWSTSSGATRASAACGCRSRPRRPRR